MKGRKFPKWFYIGIYIASHFPWKRRHAFHFHYNFICALSFLSPLLVVFFLCEMKETDCSIDYKRETWRSNISNGFGKRVDWSKPHTDQTKTLEIYRRVSINAWKPLVYTCIRYRRFLSLSGLEKMDWFGNITSSLASLGGPHLYFSLC